MGGGDGVGEPMGRNGEVEGDGRRWGEMGGR